MEKKCENSKCGAENPDDALVCSKCGQILYNAFKEENSARFQRKKNTENWFPPSWIGVICCSLASRLFGLGWGWSLLVGIVLIIIIAIIVNGIKSLLKDF
ncbi:MAG: zinc-ribbon domain-containing protein [Culturomica sp.]|jgi:hypothetical protein|nr:zinc-ribbon domain-containing protein [Culturomica sp.]